MPDQEVLEIAMRQAFRYTIGNDPTDLAHSAMVFYRLLEEAKAKGFRINDDVAVQAMLEKMRENLPP